MACNNQREVSKSAKREAAVSAGEAAPAIVQDVMIRFCAHLVGYQSVRRRVGSWLATCNQVGSWPAHSILDNVREEEGENHADEPAENGHVCFVRARASDERPCDECTKGHCAGVDEQPGCDPSVVFASLRSNPPIA